MPNDTAGSFARCGRGLVIGPAGCGKTYMIAEAVGSSAGRQLVLTHTHAGVAALRSRLAAQGVPASKYRVTTIDSLCLCYSNAFPRLARWACAYPDSKEKWKGLRHAACRVFGCRAPLRVLRSSFDGVFVDEYQDCCGSQHAVITELARALPCRAVGDPLQAIYRKLHADDIVSWQEVLAFFPVVGALEQPYRWENTNPALGAWLMDVRARLERGRSVDFGNAYGSLKWIRWTDARNQKGACKKAFAQECVVAICDWPDRCVGIAEGTRNHFSVLESVECPDLLAASEQIESCSGLARLERVVAFGRKCLLGMSPVVEMLKRLKAGEPYRPRSLESARLWEATRQVVVSDDMEAVLATLQAIEGLAGSFRRRDMWCGMKRALQGFDPGSGRTLRETVWASRDNARRNGRRVMSKRMVATPLLIKGLEFKHALLLDAAQMGTAEELYVALTRGSSSLTVLSTERTVARAVPAWLADGAEEATSVGQGGILERR